MTKKYRYCLIVLANPSAVSPRNTHYSTRKECATTKAGAEKIRKKYLAKESRRYKIEKQDASKPLGPKWRHK